MAFGVIVNRQLVKLTQARGGRGTGTKQNKPLSRQLEQEARKERVFHPEEDWQTHWDCDKTATQSLQRPPIVRASNTHTRRNRKRGSLRKAERLEPPSLFLDWWKNWSRPKAKRFSIWGFLVFHFRPLGKTEKGELNISLLPLFWNSVFFISLSIISHVPHSHRWEGRDKKVRPNYLESIFKSISSRWNTVEAWHKDGICVTIVVTELVNISVGTKTENNHFESVVYQSCHSTCSWPQCYSKLFNVFNEKHTRQILSERED